MPHTSITDQISTDNSFYGIDYQDYIDESNNFTDERKRFSEIRKMKVSKEVLPLIQEIHNNLVNTKSTLEKNKTLVNKLIINSKKYTEPVEKLLDNLLFIELKLGTILNVSNESIFKDYKPEIIPRSNTTINDNKYSEMLLKLFTNYGMFDFSNKGDITNYWCKDFIELQYKDIHKTLNGVSDFEYKWNSKSPLNFIITDNNKKILIDSLKLFFKVASELNHFKLYINNSKIDDKCPSYIQLKSSIEIIKNFYEKVKESTLDNKNISKESNKVKNLITDLFEKPLMFIDSFIIFEDYKNQLSKIFSFKVKHKHIHQELKKILDKNLSLSSLSISENKNIKEEQEKMLNNIIYKDLSEIQNLLLDIEHIGFDELKLFYVIFSDKDSKSIYGTPIKTIFKYLEKYLSNQSSSIKNRVLSAKLSDAELNKYNILFDLNSSQHNLVTNLNEILSKKDSPVIKSVFKISIICRILQLIENNSQNDIVNCEALIKNIFDDICTEFKSNTYIDNVYYFSFFDIFEKFVKRTRINSLGILNNSINTLTINTPSKLKNHITKKKLKPKELETYLNDFDNSISALSFQIKMQKKYIHIFEKIIELVNEKIDRYSKKITHKDVQKNLVMYSAVVLNKDPRNIPKSIDWNWILNILYSSKQDSSFTDDMLNHVYEFIEHKSKPQSIIKESISEVKKDTEFHKNKSSETSISEIIKSNKDVIKTTVNSEKTVILDNDNNIFLPKDKKYKDLNKDEQDNLLNKIVNSPDLHKTKILNSLGISSADIISFVLRQNEKKI